jgi:multiple sugar transport system ATP-binding protein
MRVKIPAMKQERLARHAGERVVLGVRPEALRMANGADSADHVFDSTVEVVEPLGSEILLDVRAGEHPLVARLDPATRVKVHETVRLALDPERLHFFDAITEAAI